MKQLGILLFDFLYVRIYEVMLCLLELELFVLIYILHVDIYRYDVSEYLEYARLSIAYTDCLL